MLERELGLGSELLHKKQQKNTQAIRYLSTLFPMNYKLVAVCIDQLRLLGWGLESVLSYNLHLYKCIQCHKQSQHPDNYYNELLYLIQNIPDPYNCKSGELRLEQESGLESCYKKVLRHTVESHHNLKYKQFHFQNTTKYTRQKLYFDLKKRGKR